MFKIFVLDLNNTNINNVIPHGSLEIERQLLWRRLYQDPACMSIYRLRGDIRSPKYCVYCKLRRKMYKISPIENIYF
jgi:hypothetical protein